MSWGSTSNSYSAQARYVDQFMWDYPESLIIYAAGNSGADGYNTVGSPHHRDREWESDSRGCARSLNSQQSLLQYPSYPKLLLLCGEPDRLSHMPPHPPPL